MSELNIEFEDHATMAKGVWIPDAAMGDSLFVPLDDILCVFHIDEDVNHKNSPATLIVATQEGYLGFSDPDETGLEKLEEVLDRDTYFKAMAVCPYQRNEGKHQQIILAKEGFHFLWRSEEHGLSITMSDNETFGVTYLRHVTQLDEGFEEYIKDSFFAHPQDKETYLSKRYYPELALGGLKIKAFN